jgi:dihydrofolate reductase
MKISLIAAMSRNRVIGANNGLPWRLPEDLKYFKRVTQGRPVVMGRKTYESIGRLLPGRENRIVTRQKGFELEGARVFHSLSEAIQVGGSDHAGEADAETFVIGGAEIYAQAMSAADRIYLTLIDREVEGDAYFPVIDRSRFREVSREDHPPSGERDFGFSFLVLERVTG